MFSNLPLKYLVAFEAVARHCSIVEAAREISLTSSAISKQIQALESHVGVKLFMRSTRHITLTDQGKAFAKVVANTLRQLQGSIEEIAPDAGGRTLRLVASTGFLSHLLMPKIPEFKADYPGYSYSFSTSNEIAIPDFDVERTDAAVVLLLNSVDRKDLFVDPILKGCYLQPVCAHSLLPNGLPFERPDELAGLTWLKNRTLPDLWDHWLSSIGAAGLQPREVCWFDDAASLLEAAAAGVGVWMIGGADHVPSFSRLAPAHRHRAYSDVANFFLVYPARSIRKPVLRDFRHWLLGLYNPGYSGDSP